MNIANETRSALRGLATGLVVCLATTLVSVPAHASDLFVSSDTVNIDSLYRYNKESGKLTKIVDLFPPANIKPFGVYIDSEGTVYVTSRNEDSILSMDRNGNRLQVLVQPNSGGLNDPFYVIERDGLLYVSSRLTHEIKRYDAATGAFVDNFVVAGSGGLNLPRGLRFGPDNNLYVNSSGSHEVLSFNGVTGGFIEAFLEEGEVQVPCGLAFDGNGNMCVASARLPGDPNHAGGVFCYDWASRVRIARVPSKQTCGLDFGPKGLLYIVFAGDQQVGKYLLRHDRLKIIDDLPFPKALAVSP